jgi:hypothetical protein
MPNNLREKTMRNLLITAAAMTALLASAPANAIENYGPKKVGNQCFSAATSQGRDLGFGNWGACPQPASVAAAPTRQRSRQR